MKKIILITFAILATLLPLRAQEFQWANNFSGEVSIVCAEADQQGGIYVLGIGKNTPRFQGEIIGGFNQSAFLIKLNNDGQLVWKRMIYSTESSPAPARANFMRMVDGNSLEFAVEMTLATYANGLYYLDTLIPKLSGNTPQPYPFPKVYGDGGHGTAFIRLDLDGNLLEHHFLRSVSLDSTGQPLRWGGALLWNSCPFWRDSQGYLYLSKTYDYSDNASGGKQFSIMIDGDTLCHVTTPGYVGTPMVLKISPGFDSVLWCKPLVYNIDSLNCGTFRIATTTERGGLVGDNQGNIYQCGTLMCTYRSSNGYHGTAQYFNELVDTTFRVDLILGETDDAPRLNIRYGFNHIGFLAKYDPNGNLLWFKEIQAENINPMHFLLEYYVKMYDAQINEYDQLLYVAARFYQGTNGDTTQYWNLILDDNGSRNHINRNAGFLAVNLADGSIASYGYAPSSDETSYAIDIYTIPSLAIRNNQIMAQVTYKRDLTAGDHTLTAPSDSFGGTALVRWTTDGHTIDAINFGGNNVGNEQCAMAVDTTGNIYLTGKVARQSTFGDLTVYPGSYVAKLSDPTFNAPYVPEPKEQSILWEQELTLPLAAAALPLTATATSGLTVSYSVDDPAIARLSHDTLLLLAPGTTTLRANQPGDAWWLPAPELPRPLTVTPTPNGILTTDHSPLTTEYYDLLGRKVSAPHRGVYLERTITTQGVSTRKIIKP